VDDLLFQFQLADIGLPDFAERGARVPQALHVLSRQWLALIGFNP
jgi:hypothetical protein